MENTEAVEFLQGLLGKQLRITTTDTRMFIGEMKCTDKDSNVILSRAQEYRMPTTSKIQNAASEAVAQGPSDSVKVNMTSRFLGLIVVPGQHIAKIEVEEPVRS